MGGDETIGRQPACAERENLRERAQLHDEHAARVPRRRGGIVYALALPFVALVTAYVYLDARAGELEPSDERKELPAEIELKTSS